MPYKSTLQIFDINSSILLNLKDFIEELLNLDEIGSIVIPIAIPPKIEYENFMTYPIINIFKGVEKDKYIKGIYQDIALLKESAEERLNKIVILKKLGGILKTEIDYKIPLEKREIKITIDRDRLLEIISEIEIKVAKEQKEEEEQLDWVVKKIMELKYR